MTAFFAAREAGHVISLGSPDSSYNSVTREEGENRFGWKTSSRHADRVFLEGQSTGVKWYFVLICVSYEIEHPFTYLGAVCFCR